MRHKISRILRHEGWRGVYARLRYPKKMGTLKPLPSLDRPFRILGGSEDQIDKLCQTLASLGKSVKITMDEEPVHCLYISPDPMAPRPDENCTILFKDPVEVIQFCRNRTARKWLKGAGYILVPSPESFRVVEDVGIPSLRIFVVSWAGKNPRHLAGGLARWLVSAGGLKADNLDPTLFPALDGLHPGATLCLSLPETPSRREAFLRHKFLDIKIFDGIRMTPAWVGCGWSYRTMARAALAQSATPLTICEDDFTPPPMFDDRLANVQAYLAQQSWDLFSGLLTDLADTARIIRVDRCHGMTFVHLDFATGMVYNIYGPRVLAHLAAWAPENGPTAENTIDAWLSKLPDLRVITTLPFLVGHDSRLRSSLFGFDNRRYDGMIERSQARLFDRVQAFEQERIKRPD